MATLSNSNLFDRYTHCGPQIVLAVSGGGDSMALLHLMRLAQSRNPNLPALNIVTVDHGLRQGFRKEAALVEAFCAQYQLPWQLVRWEGEKPKTGIMAAARLARYHLLANAAEDIGATTVLTGHTLDDQNETSIMRAERGSASPMESDVLFERRVVISRPLLNTARAGLREHLATANIAFADDPTNLDMRFERARLRLKIGEAVITLENPAFRQDLIGRAAEFITFNVKSQGDVLIIFRPSIRDKAAEVFALRYLAATLGGFEYPAPVNIGERLFQLLGEGQRSEAFTAQRCRFVRVDQGISICREQRHQSRRWLPKTIAPFETFCGYSLLVLANALAESLGTPQFILPLAAAI